jgi:ribosomal-protein-alanine N-acetyltransferase
MVSTGIPMRRASDKLYLREPVRGDRAEFLTLVRASRAFVAPWSSPPADARAFRQYVVRCRRPDFKGMLLCRAADDRIVGVFNLSQIFLGNFRSAYLGYWVGAGFAGRGYMTEGMRLVLRQAFVALRLHRVEANIQPGNHASLRLVRRCGFRREGYSPRYLKIRGRWRDHERWAILAETWRGRGGGRKRSIVSGT